MTSALLLGIVLYGVIGLGVWVADIARVVYLKETNRRGKLTDNQEVLYYVGGFFAGPLWPLAILGWVAYRIGIGAADKHNELSPLRR